MRTWQDVHIGTSSGGLFSESFLWPICALGTLSPAASSSQTKEYQHTEIDNQSRTQTLIHVPSSMHAFSILHSHRHTHTHTFPKSSHKSEGVWSTTPGRGSRRGWVIYWLLIFQVVLTWRWSLPSLNDNICLPAGKMGNINKRYIFETKPP